MSWERQFHGALSANTPTGFIDPGLFSPEYRALVPPSLAVRDAAHLSEVLAGAGERFDLWEPRSELGDGHYRLQLYGEKPRSLDEVMPLLLQFGLRVLDQTPFRLEAAGRRLSIRSFAVAPPPGLDLMPRRPLLLEAMEALLQSRVDNDALNGLLVLAGMGWREIDVFRAYRNYYAQLGSCFGHQRFHRALLDNPEVAALLFRYFDTRFRPGEHLGSAQQREEEALPPVRLALAGALETVADSHQDRILRDLFNLIDSTLRTNFYRDRLASDHSIALKLASLGVLNSPSPRPWFEIYVHAKWMEGIHLRGAPVARGGLRWSDRPDDFRTEILDLMQTQMVKNALIVPQGAKGGFVVNGDGTDTSSRDQQGRRAYATLVRGLLDLTDNRVGDRIEPPPGLVAYDGPDPYLVVAADKGTAGLSDFANGLAAESGFWLGDAFASGGSRGYHHKQLGITARGAWVSVERHFREAGQDIAHAHFTAVGVGSMDGDVFGNGMLLSRNLRLIGAFGSHDVFLDPTPDPEISLRERKRLFDNPSLGWQDYDRSRISPGGGIFTRDARHIPLSPEAQAALGVRRASVDGEGLVRLLLSAPVDLLWLGGIGTYVKASGESHEKVADRANDHARVDASELRAKVVAEGANLGLTQRARIEYALAGGRINTDAVDNSGGVDLSDHEVNIKILLSEVLHRGQLSGEDERNQLLRDCAADVVAAVLANNADQTLCLSLDLERSRRDVEPFLDVADRLGNAGLLDRTLVAFPSRREALTRQQPGLTRPELAMLMAHAKLALKRALLAGPESLITGWTDELLSGYFPPAIRHRFGHVIHDHGLARNIVATQVCNVVIGQAGASFLAWAEDLEPATLCRAAATYFRYQSTTGANRLRQRLRRIEPELAADRFLVLYLRLEDLLADCCRSAPPEVRGPGLDPDGEQAAFGAYLDGLESRLDAICQAEKERAATAARGLGLEEGDARLLHFADRIEDFPAILALAQRTGEPAATVAALCERLTEALGLARMRGLMAAVRPRDRWERRALAALSARLRSAPPALAAVLLHQGGRCPDSLFVAPGAAAALARLRRLEREITAGAAASLAPFAALAVELEALRDAVLAEFPGTTATKGSAEDAAPP